MFAEMKSNEIESIDGTYKLKVTQNNFDQCTSTTYCYLFRSSGVAENKSTYRILTDIQYVQQVCYDR